MYVCVSVFVYACVCTCARSLIRNIDFTFLSMMSEKLPSTSSSTLGCVHIYIFVQYIYFSTIAIKLQLVLLRGSAFGVWEVTSGQSRIRLLGVTLTAKSMIWDETRTTTHNIPFPPVILKLTLMKNPFHNFQYNFIANEL